MERPQSQMDIQRGVLNNEQQLQSQDQTKQSQSVSFCELYRFAEKIDYLFMFLGTFFALGGGASLPALAYLWGKILDAFVKNTFDSRLNDAVYYRNILFYLGCSALGIFLFAFAFWTLVAERIAVKCRKAYMKGLLKQNLIWFEQNIKEGGLQKFNTDALIFQKAIGDKMRNMMYIISMFFCGIGVAVTSRWKLALVFLGILCIGAIFIALYKYFTAKRDQLLNNSDDADESVKQSLTFIKTVKILNGESFQQDKYRKLLNKVSENAYKWIILAGIATGLFFFMQYGIFSFGFWFGTHCIGGTYRCPVTGSDKIYTPGEVTAVFFATFIGLFNFMQFGPTKDAIVQGMKAAKRLYKVIDPQIEERGPDGAIKSIPVGNIITGLEQIKAHGKKSKIIFENVSFAYPNKKDKPELNKISFEIELNGITALVGQVGCGKLAIAELIMRFYEPDEGKITLNGIDLQKFDIQYLRSHLGFLGKTPSIFTGTIRENLLIGRGEATDDEIREVLHRVEMLNSIEQIGIDTKIGRGGYHLTQSQKIRICLARVLIHKPSLLILDQVSTLLDSQGERQMQVLLDKISSSMTTISIPHRINYIKNVNKIILLQSGRILESGSFENIKRFKQLDFKIFQSRINGMVEEQQIRVSVDREDSKLQEQYSQKDKQYKGSIILQILSLTEGNRCKLFIGIICCILAGVGPTGLAALLANVIYKQLIIYILASFDSTLTEISTYLTESQSFSLGVFYLGLFIFFPYFIKAMMFSLLGEAVSQNLRVKIFSKLIKLPIQWFQKPQNKRQIMSPRFGSDSRQASKILSQLIPVYIINISCILTGIILTFIAVWKMGIVSIIAIPCIAISGYILMRFYSDQASKADRRTYQESNLITQEVSQNIQAIYSYNYQNKFQQKFNQKLQEISDCSFCKGLGLGLVYGMAHLTLSFTLAVTYYFAHQFMYNDMKADPLNSIYACMTIIWPGWYAAHNFYMMSYSENWKKSAANLFRILDEKDEDQLQVMNNSQLLKIPIEGNIEFKNVVFRYKPKDQPVLNKVSFIISKGQKVAFFGPKGCGKSTIIQLLQGFYDFQGQIFIDGKQIRQYDVHHLRKYLIGVGQDAYFFKGSIVDNIKYNLNQATLQDINEAATQAKAIDFIYDRADSSSISDSQKQRIAITRVLLRKPQILMLDEATTALDRPTEKRLHDSIDFKREGRTTIVVAHRSEAILNSDRIYVLDKGKIQEEGTYTELKQKKGLFNNYHLGKNWG